MKKRPRGCCRRGPLCEHIFLARLDHDDRAAANDATVATRQVIARGLLCGANRCVHRGRRVGRRLHAAAFRADRHGSDSSTSTHNRGSESRTNLQSFGHCSFLRSEIKPYKYPSHHANGRQRAVKLDGEKVICRNKIAGSRHEIERRAGQLPAFASESRAFWFGAEALRKSLACVVVSVLCIQRALQIRDRVGVAGILP
jgi:hypothetical protein